MHDPHRVVVCIGFKLSQTPFPQIHALENSGAKRHNSAVIKYGDNVCGGSSGATFQPHYSDRTQVTTISAHLLLSFDAEDRKERCGYIAGQGKQHEREARSNNATKSLWSAALDCNNVKAWPGPHGEITVNQCSIASRGQLAATR